MKYKLSLWMEGHRWNLEAEFQGKWVNIKEKLQENGEKFTVKNFINLIFTKY
jgi:hypothetical protein